MDIWKKNILRLMNETEANVRFYMSHNILSLATLGPLVDWIIELKKQYQTGKRHLEMRSNIIKSPSYLSPSIASYFSIFDQLLNETETKIRKRESLFRPEEIRGFETLTVSIKQGQCSQRDITELGGFLDECDQRYKTNWKNLFPELGNSIHLYQGVEL